MKTETIIQIISVLISLIAPIFFYRILNEGIKKSNISSSLKLKSNGFLFISLSFWVSLVFYMTLNEVFAYNPNEQFPKFLIGLFTPVTIVLLLFSNSTFRTVLDNTSYKNLAEGQLWRILGAVFFLVAISGIGPKEFISSGIGDVTTALIAEITVWSLIKRVKWSKLSMWALIAFGVTDLLVVLFILITKYPIWNETVPTTAMAGSFPMMLIIGIAAPIALLQHVFMIRKLILGHRT